jgi:hypothetical protein
VPFFTASDQVFYEIPALFVYPQADRFIVSFELGQIDYNSPGDSFRCPAIVDQMVFDIGSNKGVGQTFFSMAFP